MHGNTAARLLGAVLQTEQLQGICASGTVPLERLPALLPGRTTACIAKVGGMHGAAPLQAAIRSSGHARIAGALPVHGCSGAAPAARVDLPLTGALVTAQLLLHGYGLVTPLVR